MKRLVIMYWIGFSLFWLAALWTDVKERKIPNGLTGSFAVVGIGLHGVRVGWEGIPAAFIGMGIGLAITLPFYLCRVVGAGDVKLFLAAGAWTGAWHAVLLWGYTIMLAGCIGIVWLVWEERRTRRLRNGWLRLMLVLSTRDRYWLREHGAQPATKMPLMLAAAPGAVVFCIRHIL